MFAEHGAAEGIGFALGDNAHSGALEPEVDPADTGEEGEDIHFPSPISAGAGRDAIAASSTISFSVWSRSSRACT